MLGDTNVFKIIYYSCNNVAKLSNTKKFKMHNSIEKGILLVAEQHI